MQTRGNMPNYICNEYLLKEEYHFSPTEWYWLYQPHSRAGLMFMRRWPTQSGLHDFCSLSCHSFSLVFSLSFVELFCFVSNCLSFWFLFCFLGFYFEKEKKTWSWMGKEVERLWEDLEEEKNIIKTYCMAIVKTIFKSNKSFKIYIRTGKLIVSLFKLNHVIK